MPLEDVKGIIPKYEIKKNKLENLINDNLDLSSSDESDSEFDNGFDHESDNGEFNDYFDES